MIELKSKVGSRGQVVIPKPIRKAFQIRPSENILFRVENDEIIIRKENGSKVLGRILNRFEKKPEPEKIKWKKLYYSQFGK